MMRFKTCNLIIYDFPGSSVSKESACSARDPGLIPGYGRSPGEGNGIPFPESLPGKYHRQRSLMGCSPQDRKELGTTERLTLSHFHPVIWHLGIWDVFG